MIAIIALSVVLYSRCFRLMLSLRRARRELRAAGPTTSPQWPTPTEIGETFRQHRVMLGAMIAAAPLLGLLGTVSGMVKTFESLSDRVGERSMEGLARGISEVLVATESGLAVAIPALLFVYLLHREVRKYSQQMNRRRDAVNRGGLS